jgi:purine-binding chemotaxis protein CheW
MPGYAAGVETLVRDDAPPPVVGVSGGENRRRGVLVDRPGAENLIFEVAGRRYGLPARDVRELVRAVAIVALPLAPQWIEGVVNLRGRIVPVIDLRARLGLPAKAIELTDQFVVAQYREFLVALRIDRSDDLMRSDARSVAEAPATDRSGPSADAVAKLSDGLAPILDLCALLSGEEWEALGRALSGASRTAAEGGAS